MPDEPVVESDRRKYIALRPVMNELARRRWAAAEAMELGWGGVTTVSQATSLSRTTITQGIRELESGSEWPPRDKPARIRRAGGGRKALTETDPHLMEALEALVDSVSRGDPQSPLRWTLKSTRTLAAELTRRDHPVGVRTVAARLREAGYSLQANRKTREEAQHPDRNALFEYLNDQVRRFHHCGQPAVSVDTKIKELVGDFKNSGRQWRPKGTPEEVRVHDFQDKQLGKAIPYGVYDMLNNQGWVSVGIDHDTAQFAAHSILTWWSEMGSQRFPRAQRLVITADGGGSNSHRGRLSKVSLQNRRRHRAETCDVPFPSGHKQVEQDRAQALQLHYQELAGRAAGQIARKLLSRPFVPPAAGGPGLEG